MSRVDENVVAALKGAADASGQSRDVARRLASWLDALASGNADLGDDAEATKRIGDLLELVVVPTDEDELAELAGDDA